MIEGSIAHHEQLEITCVGALDMIRALVKERDDLLTEVNVWRDSAGLSMRDPATDVIEGCLAALEIEAQRHASLERGRDAASEFRVDRRPSGLTPNNPMDEPQSIPGILATEDMTANLPLSEDDLMAAVLDDPWSPIRTDNSSFFSFAPQPRYNTSLPSSLDLLPRDALLASSLPDPLGSLDASQLLEQLGDHQPTASALALHQRPTDSSIQITRPDNQPIIPFSAEQLVARSLTADRVWPV